MFCVVAGIKVQNIAKTSPVKGKPINKLIVVRDLKNYSTDFHLVVFPGQKMTGKKFAS
jgi:hypothetical protein